MAYWPAGAATRIIYNDNCAILGLRPATAAIVPDAEIAGVYFGQPRSQLRYDYQGKACYHRRLTIPKR